MRLAVGSLVASASPSASPARYTHWAMDGAASTASLRSDAPQPAMRETAIGWTSRCPVGVSPPRPAARRSRGGHSAAGRRRTHPRPSGRRAEDVQLLVASRRRRKRRGLVLLPFRQHGCIAGPAFGIDLHQPNRANLPLVSGHQDHAQRTAMP
jgi:hypothetical protein